MDEVWHDKEYTYTVQNLMKCVRLFNSRRQKLTLSSAVCTPRYSKVGIMVTFIETCIPSAIKKIPLKIYVFHRIAFRCQKTRKNGEKAIKITTLKPGKGL